MRPRMLWTIELHYFRIQDKLDGTREAVPDLADVLSNDVRHLRHAADDPHVAAVNNNKHNAVATVKSETGSNGDAEKLTFDRVTMSKNIKSLMEEMNTLCDRIIKLLQIRPLQVIGLKRPITCATITENKLYGRDAIFSQTIDDMTNGTYHETLSVLPIVGPGGIGKTTFTQHLYNHERTKEHFQVRVWVCVSTNFDVLRLTQEILSCIPAADKEDSNQANNTSNLSQLHESIEQRLKSKSFLIVFDDIWECKNKSDWDTLLAPFKKGETKGNMVIVTARIPKIAVMVKGTVDPINLEGLEPHEFWKFFKVCVFGYEHDTHDLIDIARQIAKKLRCSPLAAKTVAPLLHKNHSREHWMEIVEKKEWKNQNDNDDIMPALKISYDYLPFHLKKCFSYCALFPEDYKFNSPELIRFWDAIGIIDTSGQTNSVEDLGSKYLKELVDNGFLIKKDDDRSEYYMLHDLLHELAQCVSKKECASISFSGFIADDVPLSVRHISVTTQEHFSENIDEEMDKLKRRIGIGNLRSLMILPSYRHPRNRNRITTYGSVKHARILKDTFDEIKNLRVLFIYLNPSESLPLNFSKLIHLRYLKFEIIGSISLLPSAISRFYHLNYCFLWNRPKYFFRKVDTPVPKNFNHLINLRHLHASSEFHSNIPGVGKMQCLEVLHAFCVKKKNVGFELAELGKLRNLRGHLEICDLQKVKTKEEAEEANLKNKCSLEGLTLVYDIGQPTTGHDVIDGLQPHPSLRNLAIHNHGGPTGPSWLSRDICVTSLECLSLSGISWDTLPPFGRLPLLKSLRLCNVGGLRQFQLDSGGLTDGSFKHLKTIVLSEMQDLVEWIGEDNNSHLFSMFEHIYCYCCPNLTMLPFSDCNGPSAEAANITWFPKLRGLVIENCPKLSQLPPMPYTSTLAYIRVRQDGYDKLFYESSKNALTIEAYRGALTVINMGKSVVKRNEGSLIVIGYSGALAFHNMGIVESMGMENAPHISLTDLQMLNSLRKLHIVGDTFSREVGGSVVLPLVQKLTLENFHPKERLLSNVFKCLPALSEFEMERSNEDHGELMLQFPSSSLLHKLEMACCDNLVLSAEDGGALRDLTSLHSLRINRCGKMFSHCSLSEATQIINLFPASLRELAICQQADMLSIGMLSNLTSLTSLSLLSCHNFAVDGLSTLITLNLKRLEIHRCGSIDLSSEFARIVPVDTCQLEHLVVDCIAAVLVAPVCTRLSAALGKLEFFSDRMIERFTEDQEKALELLTNLEELTFSYCSSLESLPEVLHCLCSLKKLSICDSPKIQRLPEHGFPTSLKFLSVKSCCNEFQTKVSELKQSHPNLKDEGSAF
ncbi:hypothetical protein EJB05_25156, partial [Eragrostis curvula]